MKTDVRQYYASIDHHRLLERLAPWIPDRRVLNLIGQYLKRRAERGGLVWEYQRGIALGLPPPIPPAHLWFRVRVEGPRAFRFNPDMQYIG